METQYVPPVTWVDDPESMMRLVRHIEDTGECAVDTETTGLNRSRDRVLFWSACPSEDSRYCLSEEMLRILEQELIRNPNIVWYFTNQNFDFAMLENSGVSNPVGDCYDTLVMDWMVDENRQGRHGLKEASLDHLGFNMREFKEAFSGRKRGESLPERLMREMRDNPESAKAYSSLDAWATFRLYHCLRGKLEGMTNLAGDMVLWDYFNAVEMPFTRVLHKCSRRGIMIDAGYMADLSPQIGKEMDSIHKKINRIAGHELNLKSTPQVRALFFEKLGVEPIKMTDGGDSGNRQPSTDESCLQAWSKKGIEAATLMLKYRELQKIKGTYVDGLSKWIDKDLRIHPTLTQHVTVTGRQSSVDPNLQNIPRSENDPFGLRNAFIPKEGHIFLVSDYAQLEMRLMAHFSEDANMIDVIKKGWDIHTGSASLMYEYPYEEIIAAAKKKKSGVDLSDLEKKMVLARQAAKTLGFALNYGEGPRALGETLGISIDDAKALIRRYFKPYPNVERFIDGTKNFILDHAMVETLLGRPRRFHELHAIGTMLDKMTRWNLPGTAKKNLAQAERQSVNSIIQGSARDVIVMAMLRCEADQRLKDLGVEMLLQIHDELIFEIPEETVDEAAPIIQQHMEHPLGEELLVPLSAEAGRGFSWAAAKG